MTAGVEGVGGLVSIDPKGRLQSHRELSDWAHVGANGTDALRCVTVFAASPVVLALNVAAFEVDVRRLIGRRKRRLARKDERVETDGTLRFACVQLVHHRLEMTTSGTTSQSFGAAPQERRAAQIDE